WLAVLRHAGWHFPRPRLYRPFIQPQLGNQDGPAEGSHRQWAHVALEDGEARARRTWRVATVAGMLVVPVGIAVVMAAPAAAVTGDSTYYAVTATVNLGSSPGAVGVDSSAHTVYVSTGSRVSVISGATNSVTATMDNSPYANGVVDSSTGTGYQRSTSG